jgi:effector-binding domain-containing protein
MTEARPTPSIIEREAQPYVGVRELITMTTFARVADQLDGLFAWLAQRGVEPAGPPFFRYLTIDMERFLDVEAGVPVKEHVAADGPYFARTLPAGPYATVSFVGHPDGLVEETARLLAWADEEGLTWDVHETPACDAWGCRLELLLSDPAEEPDMNNWRTELVFKLADEPGA